MTDADQAPSGTEPAQGATAPRPTRSTTAPPADAPAGGPTATPSGDDAPTTTTSGGGTASGTSGGSGPGSGSGRRRRGSRGGRGRGSGGGSRPGTDEPAPDGAEAARSDGAARPEGAGRPARAAAADGPEAATAERSATAGSKSSPAPAGDASRPAPPPARPRIGDTRPAPPPPPGAATGSTGDGGSGGGERSGSSRRRRRRGRGRGKGGGGGEAAGTQGARAGGNGGGNGNGNGGGNGRDGRGAGGGQRGGRQDQGRGGRRGRGPAPEPVTAVTEPAAIELDEQTLAERRGRERKGKAVGRYTMAVHVRPEATQIAILEGRALIEHQVSRPADDISQIHGNIYLGRVQNVLPGMEAAFIDIGTPKNAVLYRGDTRYDPDDLDTKPKGQPKIEEILKPRQMILCQVTKNPIAHKGARLTQEVSLPGRFVVLVPNSTTYGISKRLPDDERKRLRGILDKVRPAGHGLIVRTAAEGITASEIEADVARLARLWEDIERLAERSRGQGPTLLYREPDMAVRMIREELTKDFRRVLIDDRALYEEVRAYVETVNPALAERVEHYDTSVEPLPLFEKHHIHEQLHKALDRKVWLPSGGSLIIEHTEALTVIDVNTGKNVGKSSLEQTVFANNLEAAEEVARQLRLRDIGGIIVIDFIDMEVAKNREEVIRTFRAALARDKTRTQVFDISELGLVEMTRKRIGEGLLESFAETCEHCQGRGVVFDPTLYPDD